MSNLFSLIKINFSNYFNISSVKSFTSLVKVILFISLYFIIGIFIYFFARYMVTGFNALHIAYLALSEFFGIGSMFILAISVFKVDTFNEQDSDFLLSLPISKKTIVASKLINIYFFNLLLIILIMVPVYIAYLDIINSSGMLTKMILSLFIIPIIPTTIAVFINSIITIISSRFKYKKLIHTILMLALITFSMYFAFNLNSNLELNIFDIENSFNNFFNNVYPLTKYFTNMIINNDLNSTIIFVGLSLVSIIILILFLSIFYNKIATKYASLNTKIIKWKKQKNKSPLSCLIKKELKRIVYSPNYLLNSCLGLILLIIIPILLIFFDLDNIQNIPITKAMVIKNLPLIFIFFLLLSCTSSSSLSLEGKNLYILKMLPLKFKDIWLSKVLSNIILNIGASIIALIIFNIAFNLDTKINILSFVTILTTSIFISLFGLVVNLLFPNFTWKSEIKAIKQSAAVFITTFAGLLLGLFLIFNDYTSKINYIYIVNLGLVALSIILIIFLNSFGQKIFENLDT